MPGYDQVMASFQPQEHSICAPTCALLKEARDFAERAALDFGLPTGACYQVKLAMSEAVTNAIQHGSTLAGRPDPHLSSTEEAGALVFEVLDTGRFGPRVTRRGDPCRRAAAGSSSCGC